MKNVLNNLEFQFSYFYHAKHWLLLIITSIILVLIFSFGQFTQLNHNITSYENNLRFMNDNGISESEALNLPSGKQEIELDNGDILEIEDNPLFFSKIALSMTLNSISNQYFFQNILEASIFLIFPLILTIFSINLVGNEYENKMVKIRAIRHDWRHVILAKLLFLTLTVVGFIIFTALISYIVASIQYLFIPNDIILKFEDTTLINEFNIFANMTIAMIISIIFVFVSTMLAVYFKKKTIPIIIIFTYLLIIPPLGTFGLKNILLNIVGKYFPYQGTSMLSGYTLVWLPFCFIYCSILVILIVSITMLIAKRQSKYL